GDLFFNTSSETPEEVGICAMLNIEQESLYLNSFCFGYRLYGENVVPEYLAYYFRSNEGRNLMTALAQGVTRYNLSKSAFNNAKILMPTSTSEQKAIADILKCMDKEMESIEAKKAKYEQIKQGMMQQLLTGRIRLVDTVAKTSTTTANVHFRRSVLAAEIADRLCEEPTFGHVKMEKILFLTERLCHIETGSHYHRDAAGPYDNRALRSIDSQLKKQKWFEARRTEKGNRYVPMQNRGKHKTYFDKYFSAVLPTFEKIIGTFKTQNTERCEIVATLYSAWEDLLHSNKPFADADIVNEVLNNWHESKKRISKERWLNAIQWMRENGFAPDVRND
ncbi:restriction endonuclease subunit S, partial [Bacteroides heparinolyticus]